MRDEKNRKHKFNDEKPVVTPEIPFEINRRHAQYKPRCPAAITTPLTSLKVSPKVKKHYMMVTTHTCGALALLFAFLCLPLASTFAPQLKYAREKPFYRPQSITVSRPSLFLSSSSIPPFPSANNADNSTIIMNIPSNIPAPEPTSSLPAFYSKLPSQIASPRALSNVIGLILIGLSACLALYRVDTSPLRNEPWAFRLPLR